MKRLTPILLFVLIAAPCSGWGADPDKPALPIRLPTAPIVPTPPAPVPSPLTPTVLTADLLYVIDSDVQCLIRTSPQGLVDVAADTGPIKMRGRFVDGTGKAETRTYGGKYVYTITAAATGKCELLIFPVGATKDSDIISRLLDCQVGPAPPGPGPGPPGPSPVVDPLNAIIQSAFSTDTDADKAASAKSLAAIYRAGAAVSALPSMVTLGGVMTWMKGSDKTPATALPQTRKAIGAELNKLLPTDAATPLDDNLRALLAKQFTRAAVALEGVK